MKNHKHILTLALALVLALGLLPTVALAGDTSMSIPSLIEQGKPSRTYDYADARIPVKINASYIEPDDPYAPDGLCDDILRISYVVKQETMTYDGEALEVYTMYPGSFIWREAFPGDEYSVKRMYAATVENGVLRKGEQVSEYVLDEVRDSLWRAGPNDVGNYYIIEYEDTLFSKTFGVHIIEGSQPASAPKDYVQYMGISQEYIDWCDLGEWLPWVASVPAGTVVTSSRGEKNYRCVPLEAVSEDIFWDGLDTSAAAVQELPTYSCNGRQCFTVEPGMLYEVWDETLDWDYDQERLHYVGSIYCTFFMADESVPAVSDAPAVPENTAYASTQTVNVDGKAVTFECYALKDANGNATNYIKLRDLAMLLNGSAAQFQVGWDGSVTITTKTAYTPNGSELSTPYSGDRAYQETTATTKVNGQAADLAAFVLNDDAGGGYTYYQLRDLGKALGFNVGWAADKGIFVETDKPYDTTN